MKKSRKFWKIATIVVGLAVVAVAIYIMTTGLGLSDELDFGAGAYYYADIPNFEKYLAWDAFAPALPYIIYVLLFLAWGVLMYWLWRWVDNK